MFNTYNPVMTKERIDNQIAQLQQMKEQIPMQPSINQTFQLAPTNNIRYANNIDEVEKSFISGDTPFFSKDMSVLWLKTIDNNIKTYELNEVVIKDEKDLIIESLQMQIDELKKGQEYAKSNNNSFDKSIKNEKSTDVSTNKSIKTK